jgi:drug/metabolite transporter (DMT)-like permease
MAAAASERTGIAAILAGVLFFAGQGGELVFGSPSDVVDAVFVLLAAGGLVALTIALWGLRELIRGPKPSRVGLWLAVAGAALLVLFAVQATVSVAQTGDVPDNFILFALGFLLLLVAHPLFAWGLRPALGRAWLVPLVGAVGILVAIGTEADPIHDIGLFVFEGAWVALGIALLRARREAQPADAAAAG